MKNSDDIQHQHSLTMRYFFLIMVASDRVKRVREKLRREKEKREYAKRVFNAILCKCIDRGIKAFPGEEEAILSELVNATIESFGGKGGETKFPDLYTKKEYLVCRDKLSKFIRDLYNIFKSQRENVEKLADLEVDSKVVDAIGLLIYPIDEPGDALTRPYTTNLLIRNLTERWHGPAPLTKKETGFCKYEYVMDLLTYHDALRILETMSESEINAITKISGNMIKYIEEDWVFIREMWKKGYSI